MKILTICRAGLVRSIALADVLKLHFEPVDVIPAGIGEHENGRFNSIQLLHYLFNWADKIVVMEPHFKEKIPATFHNRVMICDVGPDVYGAIGGSKSPILIKKVWDWARENRSELKIREHRKNL